MGKLKYGLMDMNQDQTLFRNWENIAQAFVTQYFPLQMQRRLKIESRTLPNKVMNFSMMRMNARRVQRECPHHGFDKWEIVSNFYDRMDEDGRSIMDHASGGGFMYLTATEAFKIVEKLAKNSHQWGGKHNHLRKKEAEGSSSKDITKEDFNTLSKTVSSLAKSIGDMNTGKWREHSQAYEVSA